MVGGAILAGVGLAGARMFKDQKTAQKKVDGEQSLISYHASLAKIMHNENHCNATLSAYFGASGGTPWANPTQIAMCNGCTDVNVNYNAGNVTSGMKTVMATAGSTWTDGTRTWQVMSFRIGRDANTFNVAPSVSGKAVMRVEYRLNPDIKPGGGRTVFKDINLNLRFTQANTPVFVECISGGESSVNNLSHDICSEAMKAGTVSTDGRIMRWDDSLQTCVLTGTPGTALKTCPAGSVIEGVAQDGTVKCKRIGAGINPSQDLMLESSCPPGSNVQLQVVDGKVRTLCN